MSVEFVKKTLRVQIILILDFNSVFLFSIHYRATSRRTKTETTFLNVKFDGKIFNQHYRNHSYDIRRMNKFSFWIFSAVWQPQDRSKSLYEYFCFKFKYFPSFIYCGCGKFLLKCFNHKNREGSNFIFTSSFPEI